MTTRTLKSPILPLAESVVTHALLVLVFAGLVYEKIWMPKGEWVKGQQSSIEVAVVRSSAARAAPAVAAVEESAVKVARKKKTREEIPVAAPSKPAGFGVETGQAESGRLGVANGVEASVRERYLFELRVWIEGHKRYPALSRRFGETGTVEVSFGVRRDGTIEGVRLTCECGHDRLNEATLAMMNGLRQFRPFPQGLSGERLDVVLPIEYVLN